jgi:hypothetical protein
MAFATEFIDVGRGVLHTGSGTVTGQELIAGARLDLQAARDGLPLRYGLVDFTDIARFEVGSGDIREVARIDIELAKIIGTARVAVIASQDVAFGMSRMWEAYVHATAWQTQVFRDPAAARDWLAMHVSR